MKSGTQVVFGDGTEVAFDDEFATRASDDPGGPVIQERVARTVTVTNGDGSKFQMVGDSQAIAGFLERYARFVGQPDAPTVHVVDPGEEEPVGIPVDSFDYRGAIQDVKVWQLVPGDVVTHTGDWATFIGKAPHPIYSHLNLVLWIMADGSWSADALAEDQEVGFCDEANKATRNEAILTAFRRLQR